MHRIQSSLPPQSPHLMANAEGGSLESKPTTEASELLIRSIHYNRCVLLKIHLIYDFISKFSDGGAFPEIHVAQYPLEMGMKGKESTSNALAVQLDAEGKVKYDAIARQGHSKDKIIYSKLSDLLPVEVMNENDPSLERPSQEELDEITENTRQALSRLTNSKIAAAMPVRCAEKQVCVTLSLVEQSLKFCFVLSEVIKGFDCHVIENQGDFLFSGSGSVYSLHPIAARGRV